MAKRENPHAEHRKRLKARFVRESLDHFEDHNVLELLLFYAIPQMDTNPLAHRLMERYGSLDAVFDAPTEDLAKVEGIGEHTAVLIKLIPALARRYCESRFDVRGVLPEYEELSAHLVAHFLNRETESVYGLFYSPSLKLVDACELCSGSLHSASFSVREVAERAILKKATYLVLAHNHPGGVPIASAADLDVTRDVRSFLLRMDVKLLDHFIVAEDRVFSLTREVYEHEREHVLSRADSLSPLQ